MGAKRCRCHMCQNQVKLSDRVCGSCGAALTIMCAKCGRETVISGNCRYCRASMYVTCPGSACGKIQLPKPDGICRYCGAKVNAD